MHRLAGAFTCERAQPLAMMNAPGQDGGGGSWPCLQLPDLSFREDARPVIATAEGQASLLTGSLDTECRAPG